VEQSDERERPDRPPGQFMDEGHEADTKRFVEEARELARRRAAGLPPFEDDDQAGGSASTFAAA
jgi:hypothetical protein